MAKKASSRSEAARKAWLARVKGKKGPMTGMTIGAARVTTSRPKSNMVSSSGSWAKQLDREARAARRVKPSIQVPQSKGSRRVSALARKIRTAISRK